MFRTIVEVVNTVIHRISHFIFWYDRLSRLSDHISIWWTIYQRRVLRWHLIFKWRLKYGRKTFRLQIIHPTALEIELAFTNTVFHLYHSFSRPPQLHCLLRQSFSLLFGTIDRPNIIILRHFGPLDVTSFFGRRDGIDKPLPQWIFYPNFSSTDDHRLTIPQGNRRNSTQVMYIPKVEVFHELGDLPLDWVSTLNRDKPFFTHSLTKTTRFLRLLRFCPRACQSWSVT